MQAALFAEKPSHSAPELVLLAGLNPLEPAFSRLAAERIGAMTSGRFVEAALMEARAVGYMQLTESLAAMFIAQRVHAEGLGHHAGFLDELNPQLRRKVDVQLHRLKCAAKAGFL